MAWTCGVNARLSTINVFYPHGFHGVWSSPLWAILSSLELPDFQVHCGGITGAGWDRPALICSLSVSLEGRRLGQGSKPFLGPLHLA